MKSPLNVTRNRRGCGDAAAFTLLELIVVLVVITVLTTLLTPTLARTQADSRAFHCVNNHAQLSRAWLMFADDHDGKLATSVEGATPSDPNPPWVTNGRLDWTISPDNTNVLFVTHPGYSPLSPYCGKNARLFKCPADQYLSLIQRSRGWQERVRSVSQNVYLATRNTVSGPTDWSYYAQVTRLTALLNPKPAETWVSIDEHPDSINDTVLFAPYATQWLDLPANYHDGGAGIAFADGHSEVHRWQASALKNPVRYALTYNPSVPANDPDLQWLRSRTPRRPGLN